MKFKELSRPARILVILAIAGIPAFFILVFLISQMFG